MTARNTAAKADDKAKNEDKSKQADEVEAVTPAKAAAKAGGGSDHAKRTDTTDTEEKGSSKPKAAKAGPDSGQKGAQEDRYRQEMYDAAVQRAVKAAHEQGVATPIIVQPPGDRLIVVGEEHRDVTHDADYEAPEDGELVQHEPFYFDREAKTVQVQHIAAAANSAGFILEIDGTYHEFDPQLAAALRRLVSAGCTNLNL